MKRAERSIPFLIILSLILAACSSPVDSITGAEDFIPPASQALWDQDETFTVSLQDFIYVDIDGHGNVPAMYIRLVGDKGTVFYTYCADINLPCHQGYRYKVVPENDFFKVEKADELLAAVTYLMNRFGAMEASDPLQYRAIVQTVLWCIIHNYNVTSDSNPAVRDAVGYVLENLDSLTEQWKKGVTIEGTNTVSSIGDYDRYGPYHVSRYDILVDPTFDLSFESGAEDAVFIDIDGNEISKVRPGQPFFIKAAADAAAIAAREFSFSSTVSADRDFWFANDHYLFIHLDDLNREPLSEPVFQPLFLPLFQPLMGSEIEDHHYSSGSSFQIIPPSVTPGSIEITKTVGGAGILEKYDLKKINKLFYFELFKENVFVARSYLNDQGMIVFSNLEPGAYVLKEVLTAEGKKVFEQAPPMTVNVGDGAIVGSFENKELASKSCQSKSCTSKSCNDKSCGSTKTKK